MFTYSKGSLTTTRKNIATDLKQKAKYTLILEKTKMFSGENIILNSKLTKENIIKVISMYAQ